MPAQHHEITVTVRLVEDEAVPDPMPKISVGDTVTYTSPDGVLAIVFKKEGASPFRDSKGPIMTVEPDTPMIVARKGKFAYGCNITLESGDVIGWKRDTPMGHKKSGGDHDIRD